MSGLFSVTRHNVPDWIVENVVAIRNRDIQNANYNVSSVSVIQNFQPIPFSVANPREKGTAGGMGCWTGCMHFNSSRCTTIWNPFDGKL
jgi:hypothetical protein